MVSRVTTFELLSSEEINKYWTCPSVSFSFHTGYTNQFKFVLLYITNQPSKLPPTQCHFIIVTTYITKTRTITDISY